MADNSGSQPPQERINVTFKRPSTDNAEEELPLKLFVVGDFSGKHDNPFLKEELKPLEDRERFEVRGDNFDAVMAAQDLKLNLSVRDTDSEDPDTHIEASLRFESLKDFEPDQIAKNIESTRKKMEIRDALIELKHPLGKKRFGEKILAILEDPDKARQLVAELGLDEE